MLHLGQDVDKGEAWNSALPARFSCEPKTDLKISSFLKINEIIHVCFSYKELGSHHSILTTGKKAEQTEKRTLLGSIREGRRQGKSLPHKTGETDGQLQRVPLVWEAFSRHHFCGHSSFISSYVFT